MNIARAIEDPLLFQRWFTGNTWGAWKALLSVLFGLALSPDQLEAYRRHTGRKAPPRQPSREAWIVAGRRGGKSLVAALIAVYLACFRDYSKHLAPGELATIMLIAADRKQARVVMRYVTAFLESVPMLSAMILTRTKESFELSNRVVIEIHTCSFRAVRGYTIVAAICDEVAFWRSEESSANIDSEVISALRPALSTIPGSLLLCISSPYARRGALWESYKRHYGKNDAPALVWQAATREMNPSVPQAVIDQAYADDEASAAAEYGAEFRRDIESFVLREAVDACIIPNRIELPPVSSINYHAFCDPSGGSQDSFTLAISHADKDHTILDLVREIKPPFSPEAVVRDYANLLSQYRVSRISGDRYAGEFPRELFRRHGIEYRSAEQTKSELYGELLPLLNSNRAELLDNPRLISQLCNLERRTARSGKDSIDHSPNAHDDLINAAAGALVLAGTRKKLARPVFSSLQTPFPGLMTHFYVHTIKED
jgi:hypothetical protein